MPFASFLVTVGAVSLAGAGDAYALGPVSVEVAARGGVAPAHISGGLTPTLGLGFGGRAGVEFAGFYGGLSAIDYLGTDVQRGIYTDTVHALLYGVEVGYGFKLADGVLTIRPQLGLGNASLAFGTAGYPSESTHSNLFRTKRRGPRRPRLMVRRRRRGMAHDPGLADERHRVRAQDGHRTRAGGTEVLKQPHG
ncbi:MAG: hypothetical protein QM744_02545 [Mesorhizobium sp.]